MKNNKQKGFGILVVILSIVALITLISFTLLRENGTTSVISNSATTNNVIAQAGIIRSRILACGIEYPSGNNGTSIRTQYPAALTLTNVNNLICPGPNTNIWNLLDGLTPPQPISGFNNWQYINDTTSMRITITATTPDRTNLLPFLVNSLGVPQTSITGSTLSWILVQ